MAAAYTVIRTPAFERLVEDYSKQHRRLGEDVEWLAGRLATAPEFMGDHVPELKGLALPIFKARCKDSCCSLGVMPFGNSPPNHQPLEYLGPQRFFNPKGIASSSPGLRGTSYPGSRTGGFSTPTGLRPASASGSQPRWGCGSGARFPRVARASQPWASSRNPVGIQRAHSRKTLGLTSKTGINGFRARISPGTCLLNTGTPLLNT